jgi:hypothetical protein
MSEWFSVLAVFWALWVIDGVRLMPQRVFTVAGAFARSPARIHYARLSLPALSPAGWRIITADVPLSLSPLGICNQPAGGAGRPAETPGTVSAWRWEDVREVGVARGWIFINGTRCCADTGHVKASELLALARLAPDKRQDRIAALMRRWFRPVHLQRRIRVLKKRTALPVVLTTVVAAVLGLLTIYVGADLASRLPSPWGERLVEWVPLLLLALLGAHLVAVIAAWRAKRNLRPLANEKRGSVLFSALLLPPQALRLRSLLSDGFFPPQHPLSPILAFGSRRQAEEYAFNAIADLRWPLNQSDPPSLPAQIGSWFRPRMESHLLELLGTRGIAAAGLLAAPRLDSPASRSYCPRCRDQFVDEHGVCPNGVVLRPLSSPVEGTARET